MQNIKQIDSINNNIEEALYYNDTIDYLTPYYDKQNETTQQKQILEINDFFNKSNKKLKKKNNKKSELSKGYMIATENIQKKVPKKSKFKPKFCKNGKCKNIELVLHLKEGFLVCTNCGQCEEILVDSDKPNYKDPVPDSSQYAYRRINHLNEFLDLRPVLGLKICFLILMVINIFE